MSSNRTWLVVCNLPLNAINKPGNQKRAVAILKRDLKRKQDRIRAEEEAARVAASAVPQPLAPPNSPVPSGLLSPIEASPTDINIFSKAPVQPMRRQSTISLSSLHRPPFPHKLDLPSAIMRLNPDELPLQDGLASPVTLAPKSSISHIPPEFTIPDSSQQVDIDLTVTDEGSVGDVTGVSIDPSLGSSAEKPIELDLDMEMGMDLFNPSHPDEAVPSPGKVKEEPIDMEILNALQVANGSEAGTDAEKTQEDIMSSFDDALNLVPSTSDSTNSQSNPFSVLQSQDGQQSDAAAMPSPGTILAGLQNSSEGIPSELGGDLMQNPGQDDYDFQQFLEQEAVMNEAQMAELFNIETTDISPHNGVGSSSSTSDHIGTQSS